MNILVLLGSPRRGGNTEILVDMLLKGCEEKGGVCKKILLYDCKISPCRELYACTKNGECAIRDDMDKIIPQICNADRVIVASPMFFYNISAPTKAMIDRCQSLWVKKHKLHLPISEHQNRKGIFIGVGATKGENLFVGARLTIKYFFDAIDVPYAHELLIRRIDEKGAIKEHPEFLTKAYELGKEITSV
ncbi:MAG: flavodoxin family protein [bacterium]